MSSPRARLGSLVRRTAAVATAALVCSAATVANA